MPFVFNNKQLQNKYIKIYYGRECKRKAFQVNLAPNTTQEWKDKVIADLKGADFDKKLVWRTNEGFNVQPMYRLEDMKDLKNLECFPGEYPFVRGNKKNNNEWFVRQDIVVEDVAEANKKALECSGTRVLTHSDSCLQIARTSRKPTWPPC